MIKFFVPFLSIILLATLAYAQAPASPVDPRIAGPMIKAQAAEIALRDAGIRALQEDAQKREADLADWFKGWFGTAEKSEEKH